MKKTIALTLIALFFAVAAVSARVQGDTTLVAKKLELARRLMDEGLYDESVALLDATDSFDSARTAVWPYERGLALSLKGDRPAAIRQLMRAARFRDASADVYRLLGDCHLLEGDHGMALDSYLAGLQKFPDSGWLHYGIGVIYVEGGAYNFALDAFLEGLERDPALADNWFAAAAIQFATEDEVFGMINGETALYLDLSSEESALMSDILLETWRRKTSSPSDGDGSAPPFIGAWEATLSAAVPTAGSYARTADIPSLIEVRRRFIENWFSGGQASLFPCALFNLHRAMIEAGHFEAYNHWLFSSADPAAFASWQFDNRGALDAFVSWRDQNPVFEP